MNDTQVSALAAAFDRSAANAAARPGDRTADAARPPAPPGEVELIGRPTPQRTEVLQALAHCEEFISAQLLHAGLLAAGSRVGLSTVYRTLTALVVAGRADVVRDANGERLFRYRPDDDHRHYLLCRQCGISIPVDAGPVETWADQIARTSGFADVQHTVELTGTCTGCIAARAGN
ncbi:Fur family transcriptional regulator [Kitasatospora humi]|uniref:Fur family transcriptional regulator n=1 Tax=Kitasatospora humi TaxID=2893891 RepID=UPI0027DEC5F0|nr:Fur family transcriptional regulator [Kitasatospora humi]